MSDLWNTDGSLAGGAVNMLPVSRMPSGVEYAVRACNCLLDKQDIWTAQDVEQSTGDDLPMSLDLHAKKKSINYYYSNITT